MTKVLIAIPLIFIALSAQPNGTSFRNDTLAWVDGYPVTTMDLYRRIALMPYEDKVLDRDFESVKQKGVASLIAERLLAELPVSGNVDEQRKATVRTVLERLFVRDLLFRREVRDAVEITDAEMLDALRKYPVKKQIIIVQTGSAERSASFLRDWNAARKKGSIPVPLLSAAKHDTLLISLGAVDSVLEAAAFTLKQRWDAAGPVASRMFGPVVIIQLEDVPNADAMGKSFAERHAAVQNLLRERKESQRQFTLVSSWLKRHTMEADTMLFFTVAERMHSLMMRDTSLRRIPAGYRYLADDITSLTAELQTSLDASLIRGSFGTVQVGMFLEYLNYYEFAFASMRPSLFVRSFFRLLTLIAESEIIAQEGYQKGLNLDPEVRKDVALWIDHQQARIAVATAIDTVSVGAEEARRSLDTRRVKESSSMTDSLIERERRRLTEQRRRDRMNEIIAAEAYRRRIIFDQDAIRRADIPDINMITRRTIGFGGRLNAAPMLFPQWEWIEQWQKRKELTP